MYGEEYHANDSPANTEAETLVQKSRKRKGRPEPRNEMLQRRQVMPSCGYGTKAVFIVISCQCTVQMQTLNQRKITSSNMWQSHLPKEVVYQKVNQDHKVVIVSKDCVKNTFSLVSLHLELVEESAK
ncbi:hypothetical protein PR048_020037 [Dryococelus australis]|uniref:Uncharacterized protein n=1 Tax=Dryococelus australis TaxID=614101 RepID=A0ABQ9H584_9NEOP|nr:hypothetical protein PR048_020037 [Dryococelus australis]